MNLLERKLKSAKTVAIMGHIKPDGDCIGSCLGLYNYIKLKHSDIDVNVYLDSFTPEIFSYLKGFDEIKTNDFEKEKPDLSIILDCSDRNRLTERYVILENSKDVLCIDHHKTNDKNIKDTILEADSSSTCEVLYELLDKEYVDTEVAKCLYTGIVPDTGIFKYSSTSKRTMEISGELMSKGIDFTAIQDIGFYNKTYAQNQVLGRTLLESVLFHDKKCIFSYITKSLMNFYEVNPNDLEGIVEQLRDTQNVEVAIFFYETETQHYKVSLRSKNIVDVSIIAKFFGGGGHERAAGCNMFGSPHDVVNNISNLIYEQMK